MGIFKKNVSVADFCNQKLQVLMSSDPEDTWEAFRTNLSDPALGNADSTLYYANMRGVYLQLLGVSVTKTHSFDVSLAYDLTMSSLLEKQWPDISKLYEMYNTAYGSSTVDGIAAMIPVFSDLVTGSELADNTQKQFYLEFVGVIGSMLEEFKEIRLKE